MGARHIEPEEVGEQITPPEHLHSGLTWMLDPWTEENRLKYILTRVQLTELQNSLDKAQAYHRRYTFALALTACIAIGLSLTSLLLMLG